MALKEKVRLQLEKKGFFELYDKHSADWVKLANDARTLIRPLVASGDPTVDDIKSVLLPLVELHKHFRGFMESHPKLIQQYWASYFTDYLLHKVYKPTLHVLGEKDGKAASS
jgi:hypothetical protein